MTSFLHLVTSCLLLPYSVTAPQVQAMDLLPYLTESPPTTQVDIKICNVFQVVEKPYYVLFGSCWLCAVMQQIIDVTRNWEEKTETLGNIQKSYVCLQLVTLVTETVQIFNQVGWLDGANLWSLYNLYVYMFVHSAVFARSVMMSMIVWDWYNMKLLKKPVFGQWDARGFADWERALLLVSILQFGSSAFVMVVVVVTHLVPGLLLYHPIFLLTAAFVNKIRGWLTAIGGPVDPEGRLGRGLVMASNSFVAITGLQVAITSMVRVYNGALREHGYLMPIFDDVESRSYSTWFECHLSEGLGALKDQDFLNLFVR